MGNFNSPSQLAVVCECHITVCCSVDVIDGKVLFISRCDQNAMGNCYSSSHVVWAFISPNNVRWGISIPHHSWSMFVNYPSHVVVYVDVIDGKCLCISRLDQNVMGNFNFPSHLVWAHHPQMCDGEV
jgi:hypothetical protein